jgi:hypothetical protein
MCVSCNPRYCLTCKSKSVVIWHGGGSSRPLLTRNAGAPLKPLFFHLKFIFFRKSGGGSPLPNANCMMITRTRLKDTRPMDWYRRGL